MANNIELPTGGGGDTVRTIEKLSLSSETPTCLIDVAGSANSESLVGDAGVFLPIAGAAAHDAAAAGNPILVGAEFDDTAPDSVDEGDVGRLRISANRNLYVGIRDSAGNERGLNVDASGQIAVTQGGTWNIGTVTTVTTVSTVTNVAQLGGQAVSMGTGARDAGTQRVTIATNDVVPASQSGTWNITNVSGTVSLPTGAATESTLSTLDGKVTACDTGAVVIASGTVTTVSTVTNLAQLGGQAVTMGTGARDAGTQRVTIATNDLVPTNDLPQTSGGLSMHKTISAASTNPTNVKASAGQIYSVQVMNTNASARYVKFYNKASAPTVGSDTPVKTLLIPGNTAGAGMVLNWDKGLEFGTGIGFALTTGITDADTGAVAANEIAVNIDYE